MMKPLSRNAIYRRRVFDADTIDLCVRWFIAYRLSYRDLVELLAERRVKLARTTILRWVLPYVPECEKRWNRFARPLVTYWRVDETYLCIRGRWHALYRAVAKRGTTIDFLLLPTPGIAVAQSFFRKALGTTLPRVSRKLTRDGHVPSHRAIERRCASMAGFKSLASASLTVAAIELAHRIRKKQFMLSRTDRRIGGRSPKAQWEIALA